MPRKHPPTPPMGEYDEAQQSFHHLMQQNAGMRHPQDPYTLDDTSYLPSGSTTSYNSPQPGQHIIDDYGQSHYVLPSQRGASHGMPYGPYVATNYRPYPGGAYQGHPLQYQTYPNPEFEERSPPTPDISDQSGPQRRTPRQSRRVGTTETSTHPSSSPKPRRAGKSKDKAKKANVKAPLSELTKHLVDVPVKDTEAWVNRSAEVRQQEKGKDGFIKRPSNSFILYRSAYAERCRALENSSNHQDISSVAGSSWAMEPAEIRAQFEEWAKIERANHQKTFPEYKFQPQTPAAKARNRKRKADETSEEPSDIEDPTWGNGRGGSPAGGRPLRPKKVRKDYRETSYTPSAGSLDEYGTPQPTNPGMYNQSYYHVSNPGKVPPVALSQQLRNQYYAATSHPNAQYANIGHVEDVTVRRTNAPNAYYDPPPPVIGLPGAQHHELLGSTIGDESRAMFSSPQVDPLLLGLNQTPPSQPHVTELGNAPTATETDGYQSGAYLPDPDEFQFGIEAGQTDANEMFDTWWEGNKDR